MAIPFYDPQENSENAKKVQDFILRLYYTYSLLFLSEFRSSRDFQNAIEEVEAGNFDTRISTQLLDVFKAAYKEEFQVNAPSHFFEEFALTRFLGQGSYGAVFEVFCMVDKKSYAIKIVRCPSKEMEEYAAKEAMTLSALKHPNIVRYHGAWLERPSHTYIEKIQALPQDLSQKLEEVFYRNNYLTKYLFIQMELCKCSLRTWLCENSDRKQAMQMFVQITSGLEEIHTKGYYHGDLRTDNIFIAVDGATAKIGDFGLMSNRGSGPLGNPCDSYKALTSKGDIRDLGLILYEMLVPPDKIEEPEIVNVGRGQFPKKFIKNNRRAADLIRNMVGCKDTRPTVQAVKKEISSWSHQIQPLNINNKLLFALSVSGMVNIIAITYFVYQLFW